MADAQFIGTTIREVGTGEVILREVDPGDSAYLILEGEVSVRKFTESGELELARLGPGEIFGEMSMVDEKPRSASIIAEQTTRLKEMRRSEFLRSFQHDPEFVTSLLRVLFERLRETTARLTYLQNQQSWIAPTPAIAAPSADPATSSKSTQASQTNGSSPVLTLEGLTLPAQQALPCNPYQVVKLPCRIGRNSNDELSYNDLTLNDMEPFQVSINHLLIFEDNGKIGIFDRGSSRGSWLNQQPIGGLRGDSAASYLNEEEAELILGDQDSAFRFRLRVQP
jgi:pSer/pThr/pTyr-binding forkhead associated (FHA) protein